MDNILVLGAGSLQVPLIEAIQSRGYNPVVVSLYGDEPGMQMVKDKVIGDFCEEQEMLQVAKEWNVCAVVTDQTDLPVRTMAYINDSLGFPSIGYKTACLFTDKFLMREKCKEIGVKTISYALVNSLDEAMAFFRSHSHSAILKPINNQGSKGVYKVCSEEELKNKYTKATEYSRDEPILIEEFITGPELVIEALTLNGIIINLVCGDTHYFDIEDVFAARERVFPSNLDPQLVNQALELNKTIVKGFGLNQGITHGEYIIDGDIVYLIEIAARGGGVYISSDIIPLMTGLKTTDLIVDIATKKYVPIPVIEQKEKVSCYIAFFLPEGEITEINGVDNVRTLPYIHHNNLDTLYLGKKIGRNIDKTSRYFMILEASSREELNDRIANIHNLLSVEIDSAEGKKRIIWT
jgi:phosphoribosylglycinamide synthetase, ATP-grasp (A) domain